MRTTRKKPANFYHNKLLKLGEKVVNDQEIGYSHLYHFGCGCVRTYSVNPISLGDRESLQPCGKHGYLVEGDGN